MKKRGMKYFSKHKALDGPISRLEIVIMMKQIKRKTLFGALLMKRATMLQLIIKNSAARDRVLPRFSSLTFSVSTRLVAMKDCLKLTK